MSRQLRMKIQLLTMVLVGDLLLTAATLRDHCFVAARGRYRSRFTSISFQYPEPVRGFYEIFELFLIEHRESVARLNMHGIVQRRVRAAKLVSYNIDPVVGEPGHLIDLLRKFLVMNPYVDYVLWPLEAQDAAKVSLYEDIALTKSGLKFQNIEVEPTYDGTTHDSIRWAKYVRAK